MQLLFIALVTFLFVGCSTTTPAVSEYRINVESTASEFTQQGCKEESLKVVQAFSPTSLMTHEMNYGQGAHKQYKFTQSQWAESPNRAVSAEIAQYLKSTKLFKNVQVSKSRSKNGLLLETNIEDFMQYFSEDEKESFVSVRISLTLIDAESSKVVATKTFKSKIEVDSINADAGVKHLNIALENVLVDSAEWFGEVCK
ncbi:MAG: ABC-type transport auxiliary lipoprotein family protein [Campylobacterota bacterium]